MYFVAGHYRQPLVFSEDALEDAAATVESVRNYWRRLDLDAPGPDDLDAYAERFFDALADDFNTPAARAVLFDWIQEGNRRIAAGERLGPGRFPELLHALGLEGLAEQEAGAGQEAERLAAEREEARARGDFARADELRDRLAELGVEVRDTPDGPQLIRRG
jgi:cysteinyl-tRNA synthetase